MDDDEEDGEDDDDTASTFIFSLYLLFESLQFWQVLNKGRVEQQFRKDSSNLTALQLVRCLVSSDIVAMDSMILVEDTISLSPFLKMNTLQHNIPSGGALEDGVVQVGGAWLRQA